jgi:hypothetical protein
MILNMLNIGTEHTEHKDERSEAQVPTVEEVTASVLKALDQVNRELPPDKRVLSEAGTILFGESGVLDSMGLVNLVVTAEQQIAKDFGSVITLADERAMSRHRSPFRTVGSLADYITALLREDSRFTLTTA